MSSTVTETIPAFTKLELRTAYGPVYRNVSTAAPRECHLDEIPIIDVSDLYGDLAAKRRLAAKVKEAAKGTGFFYIKNHGISDEIIEKARAQALT
jgi:hypothetical protein